MPIERLRINAVSHYIQKPLFPKLLDTKVVESYLFCVENYINGRLDAIAGPRSTENRLELTNQLLPDLDEVESLGNSLIAALGIIQSNLGPLAAI